MSAAALERLERDFGHAVLVFVDDQGYPLSVATGFRVDADRGVVVLDDVAGGVASPPEGGEVNLVFSHIRPRPGEGYDERRYVSLWGRLQRVGGRLQLRPEREQHWDEQELPFFELSERGVPQARRYLERLSRERGRQVKPRLDLGWLLLRATRLPFLTATVVPVLLGVAVAARHGAWHWWLAVLTLLGAACVHLGLNVANDVFDTASGADPANVTPTQFSGGSRVILYGLLSARQMTALSLGLFLAGAAIGLYLAVATTFWPLLAIGAAGLFLAVFYTAPPLRLVHRGVGEVCVALGFGPVMTLGAYEVQARGFSWEALYASLPVALLIGLILYVNEVPDRRGDVAAGKRTLPVRLPRQAVVAGYAWTVAAAFALVVLGVLAGILPWPTVLAVLAAPLALPVYRGLRDHYEQPYALMPAMARNIQLHLATGLLLVAGYLVAIAADHLG